MPTKTNPTLVGLPKSIKIGVNKYKILLVKELKHEDHGTVHGYCDSRFNKQIALNCTAPAVNMAEVLLHECLHAIWYEYGYKDFESLSEEQCVNKTGIAVTNLMLENPKLRTYFNKQWSKK